VDHLFVHQCKGFILTVRWNHICRARTAINEAYNDVFITKSKDEFEIAFEMELKVNLPSDEGRGMKSTWVVQHLMRRDVGVDLTEWGMERKLFGWVGIATPIEVYEIFSLDDCGVSVGANLELISMKRDSHRKILMAAFSLFYLLTSPSLTIRPTCTDSSALLQTAQTSTLLMTGVIQRHLCGIRCSLIRYFQLRGLSYCVICAARGQSGGI
jgi:hypothetical protein